MEIVIAAAVLAAGLVVAALLLVRRSPGLAPAASAPRPHQAREHRLGEAARRPPGAATTRARATRRWAGSRSG